MGGEKCPDGSPKNKLGKCPNRSQDRNTHSNSPALDLTIRLLSQEEKKGKDMAAAIVGRMAKKPEDLAKYRANIRIDYQYKYEGGPTADGSSYNTIPEDIQGDQNNGPRRSPENAKLSALFVEIQKLADKRENKPILAGFISSKGEKQIKVKYCSGECSNEVEISYGNELVTDNGDYSNGKDTFSIGDENQSPEQLKQLYKKAIPVLKKVVEILKRGFKFPEPKYMVVKVTPEAKKSIGVDLNYSDKENDFRGRIMPNTLVKVVYTSPETGSCYVIAKNADGSVEEGFLSAKALEPYNAAKFHPEVSPIKKAFVTKNKDTEGNGGLNLRSAQKIIIAKIPLGVQMTVLALESSGEKVKALVQFKDPVHKGKLTTGFVAAEYLTVVE